MSLNVLKQALDKVPERLLEGAEQALLEAAELMKGYAQIGVLVDTGSLRDSIRVERGGQGLRWRRVLVRAGGYVVNPKTGKMVNYARYVENMHPFMRPAFEQVRPQLEAIIRRRCLEELKRIETAGVLTFR